MPAILDPLRERDLALLFSAKAVSVAGDGIYVVALAWQVYALSNTPTALAVVGIAMTVPTIAALRHWRNVGILCPRHRTQSSSSDPATRKREAPWKNGGKLASATLMAR